jgi:hypothetical protein
MGEKRGGYLGVQPTHTIFDHEWGGLMSATASGSAKQRVTRQEPQPG